MESPASRAKEQARADRTQPLPPEAQPERGPEHDKLSAFAGRWHAEGPSMKPDGGEGHMIADETWEWLPGGFFLSYHFDRRIDDGRHTGAGYLGYDAKRGVHVFRIADNMGYDRTYDLNVDGRRWTFKGERERAVYEFSDDGRSIDMLWEYAPDGRDWQQLCHLQATRTAGSPKPTN